MIAVTRLIRFVILFAAGTLVAVLPSHQVNAQTVDRARLVIGISIGRIGGSDLWDVARQPILSMLEPEVPDTFQLHRGIQAGITVSAHGTYFVSPHFGVTGELTYLGLATQDACTLLNNDGDASLAQTCETLNNQVGTSSVYALQVGGVAWLSPGTTIQPYLKGLIGIASTPTSTVATAATDIDLNGVGTLTIYRDSRWSSERPTWTLAAGLATAPSQGIQVRLEIRDTWLAQSIVMGANPTQNVEPPMRSVIKSFPSILLGFDIVLRKQRGRRY
jgi:opacity protein-like surface antigen